MTTTLIKALLVLPPLIVIAKLVPKNVETTMFAFATTITMGAEQFGGRFVTLILNAFVGVSQDKMDKFWVLIVMQIALNLIPLTYIGLVPLHEEVREY